MNFLTNYVVGEAERTIKGLKLTNANYAIAKNLLEERYGDPQLQISSHIQKLLSTNGLKCTND